jgi:hypothetical protein
MSDEGMSPYTIICNLLERSVGFNEADKLATEAFERLAAQGFVVVHAKAVIQQHGKVTVSRELVESVLADAMTLITNEYSTNGKIHPALRHKYLRDMDDIWKLRAELGETNNE